jgi:hypothetical protein
LDKHLAEQDLTGQVGQAEIAEKVLIKLICKIIGHFFFQKNGQLGHPDEIRAKKISLGRQMNTD